MSNERRNSAEELRTERAAQDALDAAFAARLAQATPRSGVDIAALQYEAGYRAGLNERRQSLRLTRGFAVLATAAMLIAAASSWVSYEALLSERQALLAALEPTRAEDPKPSAIADDVGAAGVNAVDAAADADPTPPKRSLRPRGNDVIAAGAVMERRYLTPQLRFAGDKLQWKDLYDLSTEPVSTSVSEPAGSGGPPPVTASPRSPGGPASPWSAWPNSRQVEDLLEQGI